MRALIIENDPSAAAEIEKIISDFGVCRNARDRDAALAVFRESITGGQSFDLVTINIAMPDMEEDAIISAIRAIEDELAVPDEKKTCLIVITRLSRRQLMTDCMLHGCNEYLPETFDGQQLLDILQQFHLIGPSETAGADGTAVFNGQALVDFINRKLKRGDLKLPPAPRIAMKIRQLVGVGADINAIADLLRQDLSISAKLISVSNSVAYGGVIRNTDIAQAISRLGVDRSVEVVMSICCRGYFVTNHAAYKQVVEDLWWHSLACAHTTEMIVQAQRLRVQEDVFSLALLHDVGKLVMIQAASELHRPKRYQADINLNALYAALDERHERFGAMLLQTWGYAKAFTALIRHERVTEDETPPAAMQVLHQADLLATAAGFGAGKRDSPEISDRLAAQGYSAEQLADFRLKIAARMEQLRYLFG